MGSLPAVGMYGNISEPRAGAGTVAGTGVVDAGTGVAATGAGWGAACGAGSLAGETSAGVSLANGWVYSRWGVMTSTEVGR